MFPSVVFEHWFDLLVQLFFNFLQFFPFLNLFLFALNLILAFICLFKNSIVKIKYFVLKSFVLFFWFDQKLRQFIIFFFSFFELVKHLRYFLLQHYFGFLMFSFFMTVEFIKFICFNFKVGLQILDESFHFVDLIAFIVIFFHNLLDFLSLFVQTFLKIMLFLVNIFLYSWHMCEITVLFFFKLSFKVNYPISLFMNLLWQVLVSIL